MVNDDLRADRGVACSFGVRMVVGAEVDMADDG